MFFNLVVNILYFSTLQSNNDQEDKILALEKRIQDLEAR